MTNRARKPFAEGIKMYCGELDGQLVACHISLQARGVRCSVGAMFNDRDDERGWREAVKSGWRVVKVRVAKVQ